MTDRESFIRMILAHPDDDGPRLVYADWLEEEGEADRAEFIRIQIESATIRHNGTEEDAECQTCALIKPLKERERELFEQSPQTHSWLGPVLDLVPMSAEWMPLLNWFRRGFVESVTCIAADWLTHADEILAAQPVTKVTLTTELTTTAIIAEYRRRKTKIPQVPNDRSTILAYAQNLWPRVRTWTLPPARSEPHQPQCVVCREPATWYTQERIDATTIRGGESRVAGLRSGYCAEHRPSNAQPIPGVSTPSRYVAESNGVRVEFADAMEGMAAVYLVASTRQEIIVVRVGEMIWGMVTPAMGSPGAVLDIEGRLILMPGQSLTVTTMANVELFRLDWPAAGLAPSASGAIREVGHRGFLGLGQALAARRESPRQRINRPVDLTPGGADARSMADMTFVHPLDSDS